MDENEDKPLDGPQQAKKWAKEIDLSKKRDEDYLKEGKTINKRYRNEAKAADRGSNSQGGASQQFNILWANTETICPALYAQSPRPDIRRRNGSQEAASLTAAEILERASTYTFEMADFDNYMLSSVKDMQLPGRGSLRLHYEAKFEQVEDEEGEMVDGEVTSEEVYYSSIDWDCLLLGPAERWEDLPWLAIKHKFDKEAVKKQFPDFADKVNYSETQKGENQDDDENARVEPEAVFWEILDKDTRQVLWYAEDYRDSLVKVVDDPWGFKDFWPLPKPLYAFASTTSMVPVAEFLQYDVLADQLEDITVRMGRIIRAIRVRGIYDSTMSELGKLFDGGDNQMIPAENLSRLIDNGGLEKSIWMFPNNDLVNVLQQLWQSRQQLIQQIYEITGISDILRGQSNPNETLGAQQIKANFGSQRLSSKQKEVQKYARDTLRMTCELIAEKFSIETLKGMTSVELMTEEEKMMQIQQFQMQQQQQMQAAQQQPPQPGQQPPQPQQPPEELVNAVTWEKVKQLMENELLRNYLIDIETDSTIEADQSADQQALSSMLQGISQFGANVGPLLESGILSKDAAKQLLVSMLRRFKLGREVEEAIDQPIEETPDEDAGAKQAEQQAQQMEIQKSQAEMQSRMQELEMKGQQQQQHMQSEMQKMQMQGQQDQMAHQAKIKEIEMKMVQDREKHQFEMRSLAVKENQVGK